jgi:hypothetical protein
MTTFPRSPRVLKGAIVGLDPFNPAASVIVFQYNPDEMVRRLAPNSAGGTQSQGEVLRLKGPPRETITMTVDVDAADQLEKAQFPATQHGVFPTLASLEMLLYPKTALVVANKVLAALGVIEVIPPEAPLTLLVWGWKRIVPVRVTSLTIREQAFDPDLNPIRAQVDLALSVLTYEDLGVLSPGGALSLTNHVLKEVMATIGSVASVAGQGTFSIEAGGLRKGG